MKRIISFVLSLSIMMGLFSEFDISVFATASNTTITISNDFEEHMIGSSFAVSASYKSDTYSHNAETITYEIVGDKTGLIVDGGLSCLGSKEKDGIISLPLKAVKIGEYQVVINGPDGAMDSIKIIISYKSYDVYLAENIIERDEFLLSADTIIQLSDKGWMQTNEVKLYFNDMSVQQYVETMLIRVLIGKVIDEKNIYESYAEAASLVTKCMSGIQSIHSSVTKETTFDTIDDIEIKNQIKTYINDMYKFDVFDTLSTTIDGASTIAAAVKQASYYRVVSDVLSAEEISKMFSATVATIDSSDYENTLILAFNHVIEIITNTDLKISEHFANTAISYGVDSLKSLTLDIAKALALNSLNAVAPGLGTVLSTGMTVYEICKAIDDLCRSKLEAVQINLSALSMFCETFKHAIESHSYNPKENANILVENYKYLLSANRIAVEIQQENLDILSENLLKSVTVQPAFSLQQLLKNIDILGGNTDSLYSTYLITERYPVVLDTLSSIIDNEYCYIKTVTEDYLYYSYGMDLFKYTSDLWEIETKYVVTLDANFDDDSFSTKQYYYFSKGETLDERTRPHLRSGYDFIGWYTDRECTIEYNFDNAIDSNFTLYAKWEKNINCVENGDGTATVTSVNSRQSRISSMQMFSLTRTVENSTQTALKQIQAADSIVPLFIDGKSIVSIASNAVSPDCSSIYIPEIVENIENDAIDKSTSIICWPNSCAHRYAENNGYEYVLLNYDGTDENSSETFTYVANDDGYTATITGLVDGYEPTNLTIPSKIEGHPVTNIADKAFYRCSSLTKVVIGLGVTNIGNRAFWGCDNLKSITIPQSVKRIGDFAFEKLNWSELDEVYITDVSAWCNIEFTTEKSNPLYYAENLYLNNKPITNITLNDSVTVIPKHAFSGCDKLTSVVIGKNVISINDYAFSDCDSLTSITIPGSVKNIGNHIFSTCDNLSDVIICDGVMSIGFRAFYNCPKINNITIPNSVISIGDQAFIWCEGLTEVTLPNNITSIGSGTFSRCTSLANIAIPNNVKSIGDSAFYGCSSLTNVKISDNITSIGEDAFYDTAYYNNAVNWENDVLYIGNHLIQSKNNISGVYTIKNGTKTIADRAFYSCYNLTGITIPDSIISIGNNAFYYCDGLVNITMGKNVANIGQYAFSNCSRLTSVVIPNSVTHINRETFYDCTNLESVTIGKNIISIGYYAFGYCESLSTIHLPEGISTVGYGAFAHCDSIASITIPETLSDVDDCAFYACDSLAEIWYTGSQRSKELNLGAGHVGTGNTPLYSATWHYNACPIGAEHTYDNDCDEVCNVCEFSRTISHTFEWVIDKQNSCGVDGLKHEECSVCQIKRNENTIIEATGSHTYDNVCDAVCNICAFPRTAPHYYEWVIDKQNSCGVDGFKHEECRVCHIKRNENTIVEATDNHTYDNVCDTECNICGKMREITHTYKWVIDKQNSCSESGLKHEQCTVCGDKRNENTTIEKANHTPGELINTTFATCMEDGYDLYNCSKCKGNYKTITTFSLGHLYENGFCVTCGVHQEFEYDESYGEITITEYLGSNSNVIIPNMINGLPVTQIDNYAFYQMEFINSVSIGKNLLYCGYAFEGCTNLSAINVSDGNENYCSMGGVLFNKNKTELVYCPEGVTGSYTIPDSVKTISDRAFNECEKITSVTIPDSVTTIGEYAFRNTGITALIVPDSVTYIAGDAFQSCKYLKSATLGDGITSINYRTFGFCESLTDVDFGFNITSIGNYAFSGCNSLETINFSERITEIGDSAFSDCDGLTIINISSKVSKIGTKAFDNCPNLIAINVDSNNNVFSSVEGVLYSKDKSTLFVCPGGKTGQVVLEDSVINISNYAFYNCNKITDVVFGNNLKNIGISAFESCDSITNVNIPDNVLCIGDDAFSWCETLKSVTIGKGVKEIGDNAFHLATKLERFNVDVENTAFCSKDEVLFDKEHSILIQYPSCKENTNYSIPAGTLSIADEAFNNCQKLCLLVIPESVTDIGEFALATSNIKFVEIGKGLTNVNYYAFPYSDMVHILYYGTQEEWNNISINTDNGSNDSINAAEIHYNANINATTFEIVDPSCVESGEFRYSCTLCNREFVETLSALGHSNGVVVETIAPTCTDNGYTVYQCSVCGEKHNADWVYSLGHTKGNVVGTVNATCTQDGYTTYSCSVCEEQYTDDYIDALEHDAEVVKTVSPSCSSKGYTEYQCLTCKETYIDNYLPALGHLFENDVCVNCTKAKEDCIESLHNYENNCDETWEINKPNADYITITFSAETETEQGWDFIYIYGANDTLIGQYSGAELSSHTITVTGDVVKIRLTSDSSYNMYGFAVVDISAFCNDNSHYYDNECDTQCNVCKEERNVEHDYADATCKVPKTCKICGATSGSKLSHKSDAGTVTKKATCTATGTKTYKCTLCKVNIKTDTIAKVAHKYDSGTVTKKATCTATGVKTYTCSVCKGTKNETIAKLTTHSYSNNCDKSCNVCGKTRTVGAHKYSNACDTTCNYCNAKRTIKHTYSNSCDTSCNVCKAKRTIKHTYSNNCDTSCNVCKATRTITHSYKTTTTKATLTKNGSIVKKCTVCGKVASKSTIKYVKTFKLSTTTYTYDGKAKTPSITVKDSAGKTLKKNTDYTVTYASGRKNVGTYKVTIKMIGKYSGTKTLTFKINPAKTTVSKLTAGNNSIKVNITKKTTQVTGYQIQYSTSEKFTNAKTKTISSNKTTKYTLKGLKDKKTYYVRVRTYKTVNGKRYYSGWSTYKYKKTK